MFQIDDLDDLERLIGDIDKVTSIKDGSSCQPPRTTETGSIDSVPAVAHSDPNDAAANSHVNMELRSGSAREHVDVRPEGQPQNSSVSARGANFLCCNIIILEADCVMLATFCVPHVVKGTLL
jgi:hypothetical protein